jgi:hypothetical protein
VSEPIIVTSTAFGAPFMDESPTPLPQIGPAIGDELAAMATAYEALAPLTQDARARALRWLNEVLSY